MNQGISMNTMLMITLSYRKYLILPYITIVQMIFHVHCITESFYILSDMFESCNGKDIMYHYKIVLF